MTYSEQQIFSGTRGTTESGPIGVAGFVDLARCAGWTLIMWSDRRRQRRALARLDDRLLRDIGQAQANAALEADKPFWVR